ncbi:histidine phosphatase family protein [Catellatospora sp. KI3]|uniref:histidine phosphatase family protein n=1 Tax=Catellatospora sp. KI3 TaxID=3041620 RepID=UPI002482A75F|nr:histidine phosphatase family protein [Catellatospora sp. KI3]MDI1465621.1 histidine phosphatase family protein [Catellatospora sp. KI3]
MTRIILWRHGNTDYNAEGRVQGQQDAPLNDKGRAQAAAAAPALARRGPARLVTSDLSRAAHTAAALAQLTGLVPERDPRLRERGFGHWENLLMTEVKEQFPTSWLGWRDALDDPGDGVEPLTQLGKRVVEVIRQAAEVAPGVTTVLASHGAAIKYGTATLLGWPLEILPTIMPLQNCHWVELTHSAEQGWRMSAYNTGV